MSTQGIKEVSVPFNRLQERRRQETVYLIRAIVDHLNIQDRAAHDLWNVLTALRGPDNDNILLKHKTTARLRNAIGIVGGTFAMVADDKPPVKHGDTYEACYEVSLSGMSHEHHFIKHYSEGVASLIDLGILKPQKEKDNQGTDGTE